MNSPLLLALLCGFCLAAFRPAHAVGDDLNSVIKKLTDHYNVTADKALFGSPIFLQDMDSHDRFEEKEQRLLMQESLDVYNRILSDMLNHTQDQEIKRSIAAVRALMVDLRKSYFHSNGDKLKERLQALWALNTNDLVVQRKAVRELLPVYQRTLQLGRQTVRHGRHARTARPQRR
ncbi:interferon gamma 1 [Conger conger]|uniref:interferon gamma 1 n=1 Tax=Conger conger TaxID=82655 RepID=UPI002A5A93D6|nr:interferon gamma 1 [Conger conger]